MKLADEITYSLVNQIQTNGYEIVIPNFYFGRYEMDEFRRMKSGYIYEYEIKISRADFRADFKKKRKYWDEKVVRYKHDDLKNGDCKPNRFFFVVPEGIITVDDLPDHVGLITYNQEHKWFKTVRPAPFLHRHKYEDASFFQELATSLSFRELHQRFSLIRLKRQTT